MIHCEASSRGEKLHLADLPWDGAKKKKSFSLDNLQHDFFSCVSSSHFYFIYLSRARTSSSSSVIYFKSWKTSPRVRKNYENVLILTEWCSLVIFLHIFSSFLFLYYYWKPQDLTMKGRRAREKERFFINLFEVIYTITLVARMHWAERVNSINIMKKKWEREK